MSITTLAICLNGTEQEVLNAGRLMRERIEVKADLENKTDAINDALYDIAIAASERKLAEEMAKNETK